MARNDAGKRGSGDARRGRKRADRQRAERQRVRRAMSAGDYILSKLNGIDPNTGWPFTGSTRPNERWLDQLAIMAVPFFEPRLAPVRIKETEEKPPEMDLSKLTTDELRILERIVVKSQVPWPAKKPADDFF